MEYSRQFETRQYWKMRDHLATVKDSRKIRIDQKGGSVFTDWVEVKLTGPESLKKEIDRCAFLFSNNA